MSLLENLLRCNLRRKICLHFSFKKSYINDSNIQLFPRYFSDKITFKNVSREVVFFTDEGFKGKSGGNKITRYYG